MPIPATECTNADSPLRVDERSQFTNSGRSTLQPLGPDSTIARGARSFRIGANIVVAFVLMAVAAGCTALSAWLIGDVINQAYVNRNLRGIITLGIVTAALFAIKGLATYGHSVMLLRIGNRIVADNQRAVFGKLLNEGLGFYSDRHSTEFIARVYRPVLPRLRRLSTC